MIKNGSFMTQEEAVCLSSVFVDHGFKKVDAEIPVSDSEVAK